jgi:uncharacterized protein (DUF608 family)
LGGEKIKRRDFIFASSAVVTGAGRFLQSGSQPTHGTFRTVSGAVNPYTESDLLRIGPQRTFAKGHLSEIAFPLGGIGTGTVSLGGRGQLRDWGIFNRPGQGRNLPCTFVAIRMKVEGTPPAVKVLESVIDPPYSGSFGYPNDSAQGLPRLRGARFKGAYPFARIDFEDEGIPLEISLDAFNPFIPLNVDDSSLPVAIFRYQLASRSKKPVDVAVAFSVLNAVGYDGIAHLTSNIHADFGKNVTRFRYAELVPNSWAAGLEMTSEKYGPESPRGGSMALMTTQKDVTACCNWNQTEWSEPLANWLTEFADVGEFCGPGISTPSEDGYSQYATVAPRLRVAPGQRRSVTFLLAWYFPLRENYWNKGNWGSDEWELEDKATSPNLRNDYATRFSSAWEVGCYTALHLKRLEETSRKFQVALLSSSLPAHVLDAVSSQASTIRTNTCMLLEGRQLFAFEGCGDDAGCGPMNCTHVWNYAQTLAFLFPALERSMRLNEFKHSMLPDGSMAYRALVPGVRARWKGKPAADGQMGSIIRLYREWQISGDSDFLQSLWPQAKRALEYAWVQWDADRDGLMEGEQRNTYDTQFYGPNTLTGTLYLAALKAGEHMAREVGDPAAAETYERIYMSGSAKLETLWNGDYYLQRVPALDQVGIFAQGWNSNWRAAAAQFKRIPFQYQDGCLSDHLMGQWLAHVVGLGYLLPREHVQLALHSIYRYNFKTDFLSYINTQRIYALGDEKGLVVCAWPNRNRPPVPNNYCDEVWTGIEYQVAAHLIYEGHVEEGLAIVKAVRDRYDGARRNPWDEVEYGSHYARALSSWGLLLALSGYSYSAPARRIIFRPKLEARNFRCFFSTGTGWGLYHQTLNNKTMSIRLETLYGSVRFQHLCLECPPGWDKVAIESSGPDEGVLAIQGGVIAPDGSCNIDLGEELTVSRGKRLSIRIRPAL